MCVRVNSHRLIRTQNFVPSFAVPNNIWSRVREDRDIDDLIFGEESYYGYKEDHTCSER